MATKNLTERFWEKVDKSQGPDGCWNWTAGKQKHGYGQFAIGAAHRSLKAHRVAWTLANGPLLNHIHVLHNCDNPSCCNPKHLRIGSHQENMKDMKLRGRRKAKTAGDKNHFAKLTPEQVNYIRENYRGGYGESKKLAQKLGVKRNTIWLVASGRTWNG